MYNRQQFVETSPPERLEAWGDKGDEGDKGIVGAGFTTNGKLCTLISLNPPQRITRILRHKTNNKGRITKDE
ncbi:MAG: hypothetical protein RIB93_20510 [Coleofasciculus sp. D1-CHI-01]|uniref:hypothetical protein n=1 Tax=Coleofasciculus sp. D1-CHI-01 TaxID=3068482 RepID=UPI0032F77DA3